MYLINHILISSNNQRGCMDSNIENQLTRILSDLSKVEGINSSLIVDNNGNVLCHNMSQGTDISLFGPMAHVIISSSKRLLNSANHGEIQRVLVESYEGKALFLHLEKIYFVVLMEISANVGLVMVSAKRAASEIIEITKDMIPTVPAREEIITTSHEETPVISKKSEISEDKGAVELGKVSEISKSEIDKIIEAKELDHKDIEEIVDKITETEDMEEAFAKVIGTEKLEKILESEEAKALDAREAEVELAEMLGIENEKAEIKAEIDRGLSEIKETKVKSEIEDESEEIKTQEEILGEIKEPESALPVIRPPISFPKLPEDVKIPAGDKEKSDLILDVYEAIFLAMSIGASKIMGVAPTRGLIKRFLPLKDCKILLKDVDVESNSAIDFDKIRKNAENIPLNERENTLITDFSKIITIITENYGKVMGYGAFRGIVRMEFKVINNSYGKTMDELGIKDKIHPELIDLFK